MTVKDRKTKVRWYNLLSEFILKTIFITEMLNKTYFLCIHFDPLEEVFTVTSMNVLEVTTYKYKLNNNDILHRNE